MYNAEQSIWNTLNSVIKQTINEYEIIIVNDGSTDNSYSIVNQFISEDKKRGNFISLYNKHNGGVSSARNFGMNKAKGEFIALLDSDDEWVENKLETQLRILIMHNDIDLLGANRTKEQHMSFMTKKDFLSKIKAKDILYKNHFVTSSVIFKKKILNEIGYFDETRSFGEDALFFMKACQYKNCYLLNEKLVVFGGGKSCFGESGLSKNLWKMEKGELSNLNFALKEGIVGILEYLFIYNFSLIKFIRRILLSNKFLNNFIHRS